MRSFPVMKERNRDRRCADGTGGEVPRFVPCIFLSFRVCIFSYTFMFDTRIHSPSTPSYSVLLAALLHSNPSLRVRGVTVVAAGRKLAPDSQPHDDLGYHLVACTIPCDHALISLVRLLLAAEPPCRLRVRVPRLPSPSCSHHPMVRKGSV